MTGYLARAALAAAFSLLATSAFAASGPACPARFAEFAKGFVEHVATRQSFVGARVVATRVVAGEPEPKTISRTVSADEALGLIPNIPKAQVRLSERPKPQITLSKPDTDFQVTLTFERGRCWTLVRIDDESL